ncbi:MAG: hypothetical protein IIC71_10695 [Acidobacteria bacterium]|nr:hypothetical protein [Acidobacteriota bacterium]
MPSGREEYEVDTIIARKMWGTLESFHSMVYFVPEATEEYVQAGLERRGAHYLASRSAPMGRVGPEVVHASFFGFAESAVRRYIPACWESTTPEALIAARFRAVDRALRRILGSEVDSQEMRKAAELASLAAAACPNEGRVLFAATAAVVPPAEPHLVLWHALTLFREFRGDGHNAVLTQRRIDPVVAHAWYTASPAGPKEDFYKKTRGFSVEAWKEADRVLIGLGYVDADGRLTEHGASERESIEVATDEAAMAPWLAIGQDEADWLRATVRPWSRAIIASGAMASVIA